MSLVPEGLIPEIERSNEQLMELAEKLSQNAVEFGKALDALPEDVRENVRLDPNLRLIETCEDLFATASSMLEGSVRPYKSLTGCLNYIEQNHRALEQRIQLILAQDSQKQIDWLSRERSSLIAELRASVKNGSELLAERTGLLTDKETLAGQNQELQVTNQNLRDTNRSLQDQNSKLRRNFWIALSGGVVAAVTSALLIFKDDIRSRFEEINPASSSEILPEKPDLTK